jgi:hypothetical protein
MRTYAPLPARLWLGWHAAVRTVSSLIVIEGMGLPTRCRTGASAHDSVWSVKPLRSPHPSTSPLPPSASQSVVHASLPVRQANGDYVRIMRCWASIT